MRFEQEARAASTLNHPNIVSVYDVGFEGSVFYIVSELVEGESLRAMIARGPIAAGKLAGIGAQIAEGVAAAHRAGIVHRDLKPENVMLNRDRRVKILDFGLAKYMTPLAADAAGAGTARMTEPGTVMGTVGYMSPEQVRGQAVDHRSDIFSLGAILYEMASGKPAFPGNSAIEVLSAILYREDPPELQLPAPLESVIRRCLEKDPGQRFQSASDLAFALHQLGSVSATVSAAPPAAVAALPAAPPRAVRSVMWRLAATLLVCAAVGGAVWYGAGRLPFSTAKSAQSPITSPPVAPPVTSPARSDPGENTGRGAKLTSAKETHNPPPGRKELRPGEVKVNAKDGQRYVWIPPGTFSQGCSAGDPDCYRSEKPAHSVTITQGYWMGQTEATVGAFKKYSSAAGHKMPREPMALTRPLSPGWADEQLPMVNVTWDQASEFCAWAGMRLPTEAEWEWAARGGTTGATYGKPEEIGWYADNSGAQPLENVKEDYTLGPASNAVFAGLNANGNTLHRVGQKLPNHYGLYDMLGNVWECVSDWFGPYSEAAQTDPKGPPEGTAHVVRGGSWGRSMRLARASYRANTGTGSNVFVGFRCAGRLP